MKSTEIRLIPNKEAWSGGSDMLVVELKAERMYNRPSGQSERQHVGTYGVVQDITTRKKAEDELMIQKMHFQQLFENSPEGIVILDDEDKILNVNKGFEELFGFSLKECLDNSIGKLIVPERLREEAVSLSQTVMQKGIAQHSETVRKCKNGQEIEVSVLGYPIRFNNSKVGVYAIYSDITMRKNTERTVRETVQKLRRAMGGIIHVMVSTVEARDPYTAGHQQRVAELARSIAQEMGLSEEEVDGIRIAGSIHDLGKIKIPAEILSNPGRITTVEFDLIKTHPDVAYSILQEIEFSRPVAEMVRQHHEKMDGSGYPRGLKKGEILMEAKILTIADVVEAIASHRPYRPALGIKIALDEIRKNRGLLYDPKSVDACIEVFESEKFQL
jgi:PAS domain S-box-containing protein/putative nucleotidyltransferase with HDIG domain